MSLADLRARMRRLEELGFGVSRELAAVRRADAPSLYSALGNPVRYG